MSRFFTTTLGSDNSFIRVRVDSERGRIAMLEAVCSRADEQRLWAALWSRINRRGAESLRPAR